MIWDQIGQAFAGNTYREVLPKWQEVSLDMPLAEVASIVNTLVAVRGRIDPSDDEIISKLTGLVKSCEAVIDRINTKHSVHDKSELKVYSNYSDELFENEVWERIQAEKALAAYEVMLSNILKVRVSVSSLTK